MRKIGIIGLVVIMILFGTPLLKIKDSYQEMEYSEIGDKMLGNINSYVTFLDTTSTIANKTINIVSDAITTIKDTIFTVRDFVKGLFEKTTNQKCTQNENDNGFTCGSSEGGGGGSFGGGSR